MPPTPASLRASAEAAPPARTPKGELTRERILGAALGLFRERGYEETTMRAIAERAGVSIGNAYYYFESKEHLIQAFYGQTHQEHLAACGDVLERETELAPRLLGVMRAKLGSIMPYHRFAGILFRTAADPASPLNPFSEASRPVRRDATELFARVVDGSTAQPHPDLLPELPDLLWIYHMGIILFWIHDSSPGCDRSYRLMERTVELVARLIALSGNPLLRPLMRTTLGLIRDLRGGGAAAVPA